MHVKFWFNRKNIKLSHSFSCTQTSKKNDLISFNEQLNNHCTFVHQFCLGITIGNNYLKNANKKTKKDNTTSSQLMSKFDLMKTITVKQVVNYVK